MDLRQYLHAIRKYWWVIVIPGLIGTCLGIFTVSRTVPVYNGSVTFFVRTNGEGTANGQFAGDQFAQRRVNSYVALLSTERLANMVLKSTGLDMTPQQLARKIDATGDVNTVLLTANAKSTSEKQAKAIVDAVAVQFITLVNQVENSSPSGAAVNLEVVSGPDVALVPTRPMFTVAVRTLLGLLIGLGVALVLELRDTSVRTDEQVDQIGAGPLLGKIPFDRRGKEAPLVMQDDTQGIRSEAFRQLRTNLQFMDVENPVRVLVVTSSVAEEGKSATCTNLALAMVASGRRVLVIEADFRRPKVAEYFGFERAVGLTDVLVGRAELEHVLQLWGNDGLVVLPSGRLPPNPSELLGSGTMARLLDRLRFEFDAVIIDTPPLLPVTDAAVIATRADGVLIAVRYAKTTRDQLALSVRSLETVDAKLLGSVFTFYRNGRNSGYGTYSYEPDKFDESHDPMGPNGNGRWVDGRAVTPEARLPSLLPTARGVPATPLGDIEEAPSA